MKKVLILLLVFNFSFSQNEKVVISKSGISEMINTIEGKTTTENYNSVLEWINKTFKNPDYVIKSKIENKYIRFYAIDSFKPKRSPVFVNLEYMVEIEFKENKFKVAFLEVIYHESKEVPDSFYKNNGEERTDPYYITSKESIEQILTKMNEDLIKSCTSKSDW